MEQEHTPRKKYNLMQSTIARIVVVIVVLVLPINIMTLVLSNMVLQENREQLALESESALAIKASTLADVLKRANQRLTYMSFNETAMVALAGEAADLPRQEQSAFLIQARDKLKEARQEYQWADLMYFSFPANDFIIMYGYPGVDENTCRSKIQEGTQKEGTNQVTWEYCLLDETEVLFSRASWRGCVFGMCLNLENVLSKMELEVPEGVAFFTDGKETMFTAQGQQLLEKTGKTLEELRSLSRYQVSTVELEGYNLKLVEVTDWNKVSKNLPVVIRVLQVLSVALAILVIPMLLFYVLYHVNQPLRRLERAIDRIEAGDLDYRIKIGHDGREFEQINRSFNQMMEQVQQLKIDVYEKEMERKNIQMRYLSRQVQPHFILNAMNILYSYEPEEYPLIQKMILCISKYFRYIVKVNAAFVTLDQEMDHIQNYFEIQKARFPQLFYSIVEYEEGLRKVLVPPLLVQNFAENSIKHSLKIGNKITIFVIGEYYNVEGKPPMFRIRLADTGEGISDEVLEKIRRFQETGQPQEGLGVGIQNAIERLKYLYGGEDSSIRIWRDETYSGTNVEIILPLHFAEEGVDYGEDFVGR